MLEGLTSIIEYLLAIAILGGAAYSQLRKGNEETGWVKIMDRVTVVLIIGTFLLIAVGVVL